VVKILSPFVYFIKLLSTGMGGDVLSPERRPMVFITSWFLLMDNKVGRKKNSIYMRDNWLIEIVFSFQSDKVCYRKMWTYVSCITAKTLKTVCHNSRKSALAKEKKPYIRFYAKCSTSQKPNHEHLQTWCRQIGKKVSSRIVVMGSYLIAPTTSNCSLQASHASQQWI